TLEEVDKPYRLMVEQTPQGAATLTKEGKMIYCNRRFAQLLGRPLQSLLGRPIYEFALPRCRASLEVLLLRSAGLEAEADIVFVREDDSPVPVYLGATALREGALGECYIITDLSEQWHYRELRRAMAALRAAREQLDLAQRAGGVGTFEWNIQT